MGVQEQTGAGRQEEYVVVARVPQLGGGYRAVSVPRRHVRAARAILAREAQVSTGVDSLPRPWIRVGQ